MKCSVGDELNYIVWGGTASLLEDKREIWVEIGILSELLRNKVHREISGCKGTNKEIYDIANVGIKFLLARRLVLLGSEVW